MVRFWEMNYFLVVGPSIHSYVDVKPKTPKSKNRTRIFQHNPTPYLNSWDHSTSIGALKSRNGPFLRKNIFVTFSYINVWVNFDPNFSYLISYLNFLYIFDDVITNFWHPFWNASRHPYTKILVWACSLDSLDAFWSPRLVVWTTGSDIKEFAVILILESSSHMCKLCACIPGYA